MNVKVVCLVCRIQIKNVQNPYRKVAGYIAYFWNNLIIR